MRFYSNGDYIIDTLIERNYNMKFQSQNLGLCQQLNHEQEMVKELIKLVNVDEIENRELKSFVELMSHEV